MIGFNRLEELLLLMIL